MRIPWRYGYLGIAGVLAMAAFPMLAAASPDQGNGPPDGVDAKPPHHARHAPSSGEAQRVSGTTSYYEPAQVRHAYGIDQLAATGAGQIIGIVDAYDDPTAAVDLQTFITNFGLAPMHGLSSSDPCTVSAGPHPCFQKVFAQSGKPSSNGGWALETSLDVQWAHAVAPGADILLVEARNNSLSNLFGAVDVAVSRGAKVVSMSWGANDFSSEASSDSHFNKPGVTFTAASGDSGAGTIYPATSPYVVAVGGTTLPLDLSGNLTGPETAWLGSGGGVSAYETQPGYQANFPIPSTGGKRGSPDVAYNADPNTGFLVYDSTPYNGSIGWWIVGGTSAGAPQWAGIIALANQTRGSTLSSNSLTSSPEYNAAIGVSYSANYRDVTAGTNGSCGTACTAAAGYDFVTGLGSPLANSLVPYLASH